MRTLIISILAGSLSGCAVGSLPKFPTIEYQYLVEVRDEEVPNMYQIAIVNPERILPMGTEEVVRCLRFKVVSNYPYKIKFETVTPMRDCNMVGGFKPTDTVHLLNWIDDVYVWAQDRKKCFK